MSTKIWARLDIDPVTATAAVPAKVLELVVLDEGLVPGTDIFTPDLHFVEEAGVAGVSTGWTYDGATFAAPVLPAPSPPTLAQLQAYAEAKQKAIATGGFSFNVAASGAAPIIVSADTDTEGRVNLSGLKQLADADPGFSTIWLQSPAPLTLSAAQIQALAIAVGKFYDSTYPVLAQVLAAIAGGSVTTYAEIDASPWPANS